MMSNKPKYVISSEINGDIMLPKSRIILIEAFTKTLSVKAEVDVADGIMALLTAAAHIWDQCCPKDPDAIHKALDLAMKSSDEMFKKRVH